MTIDVFTRVQRSRFVFPLACIAAAGMVFISEGSYWRSVGTLDELGAIGAARASIQGLERSLLDAETGQRGYLLTDRNDYLKPYEKAVGDIAASFRSLAEYYADDPESMALLHQLQALTDTKLSELALTLKLYQQGKAETTRDIMLSDIGKEHMEAIRALSARLLAHETQRVQAGRDRVYRTLMLSRVGIAALSAIGLLALFFYLRQTTALERQRDEQKRLVQAERDLLDVEVKLRTAQLTELTHHLQTAREDERQRLARNLHDELGALLTSAKLDAARIKSRLADTAPEAQERLAHLVTTLNSSIALGRRIIEDLRPSTLSNLGLASTLEILAREFAELSGVEVECTLTPVDLSPTAELVVYRVVQESMTNIAKYAQARHVWVGLAALGREVEVTVRDDGLGFDPAAKPNSAYGLVGMRFRVEAEGGTLAVVSAPGQGTQIRVRLPAHTPDAGPA